ncbi:Uncharacterised protein [uncultured archaeon]|nr:Uncharacterised protein [uncultured archaeon]
MAAYPVACSGCGKQVYAPFKSSGKPLYCTACEIGKNDMTKSPYMLNLIAFLTEKLGAVKAVRAGPLECQILSQDKKGAKIICKIAWTPKDAELITLPIIAIAHITKVDPSAEEFVIEFTEENGVEAGVPNAPVQRF